jgi:hypothetical protein
MWIESHQSLRNHPKVKKAARLADINEFEMIGRLHCLWWWALDYAPDGDVTKYNSDDIEDAIDWRGNKGSFYNALLNCGFNGHKGFFETFEDGSVHIHDWMEYGGRLLEQREFNSDRARRKRELYDDMRLTRTVKTRDHSICRYCGVIVDWADRKGLHGGTYDHVNPDGDNSEDNLVVSCRSCNSIKNRRTPEQAGMKLIPLENLPEIYLKSGENLLLQNNTEQNRTEQNNTEQNRTEQHDAAKAALPRPAQTYIDAGGKFQSGTLADGTTKKDNAIRVICETVKDTDASIDLWRRVVSAYCSQWSSKSYTIMLNEYYAQGRVPGERKNGNGQSGNGETKIQAAMRIAQERTNGNT